MGWGIITAPELIVGEAYEFRKTDWVKMDEWSVSDSLGGWSSGAGPSGTAAVHRPFLLGAGVARDGGPCRKPPTAESSGRAFASAL
jgi:hypothetical protein